MSGLKLMSNDSILDDKKENMESDEAASDANDVTDEVSCDTNLVETDANQTDFSDETIMAAEPEVNGTCDDGKKSEKGEASTQDDVSAEEDLEELEELDEQ